MVREGKIVISTADGASDAKKFYKFLFPHQLQIATTFLGTHLVSCAGCLELAWNQLGTALTEETKNRRQGSGHKRF